MSDLRADLRRAPGSILKPNATAPERALEQAMRKGTPDLAPVATLMNPETCPAPLLGWLAWAVSVDVWDPKWSETTQRAVIRDAVIIHRLKGTKGAITRALATLGFRIDLSEWFEHGGAPHTFRIDAYGEDILAAGFGINPALLRRITQTLINVKPVRAHFELRIGERFDAGLYMRIATRATARQSLHHDPDPRTRLAALTWPLRAATRPRALSRITHDIQRKAA